MSHLKNTLFLFFILFQSFLSASSQIPHGKIVTASFNSPSLQNPGGENPVRRITIYLPPGYGENSKRFPAIYYLHGFAWSDSALIAADHLNELIDKAIASGKIRPVIIIMPDESTLYRGSFYANSALTGNWINFTAVDLVNFIDKNYRTIANVESRGIAGHSMGGHGALKIAMLHPEIFSVVYALSPAALLVQDDIGPASPAYKRVQELTSREQVVTGWNEVGANFMIAVGRAWSPNINHPPFYTDMPYSYVKDSLIIHPEIIALWNKNMPFNMIDDHISNLKKLKAIKLDWGRNDEFAHIPVTCKLFSKKLESLHIKHYAEEYIGTHGSNIGGDDGRMINELLPFFDSYLKFKD